MGFGESGFGESGFGESGGHQMYRKLRETIALQRSPDRNPVKKTNFVFLSAGTGLSVHDFLMLELSIAPF